VERQSAIVTGAAKRIGKALALGLAKRGFDIGLHYQSSHEDALTTKKEIEQLGAKCHLIRANLFNEDETAGLINEAAGKLSNISLLINNASTFERKGLLQTDAKLLEENLAIHVKAPFFLTCQFASLLKSGNIINIIDTMVTKHDVSYFAYLLSKKTLLELTKLAAKALAPAIRVNAIAPGSTAEPIDDLDSNYMERRAQRVPLKMAGDPKYLLNGIDYLLANPFVTGECLFIDGGAHIER
jgi:NAD(P)-dependent dehydrogenase (short-subunit alcohol dehydrogenase family)